MRHLIIAGGTGFLGNALASYFAESGDRVSILTRHPRAANHIYWDGCTPGHWTSILDHADILINLAGRSVDCRYTPRNKKRITRSRIESTKVLNQAIMACPHPPTVWINASSATIYVHSEDVLMTEQTGQCGDDFSMTVCKQWEETFFSGSRPEVRKVAARIGIVLSPDSGAYKKLSTLTRIGMGGRHGNGRQKFTWIHVLDFCRAIEFLAITEALAGTVNICAPQPTTNANLMRLIRTKQGMGFGLPLPVWLLAFGAAMIRTETELLLKSRNVFPERLLWAGFNFQYASIDNALEVL